MDSTQSIDDRLAELRALPENWDSYGGLPLSPHAETSLRAFLEIIGEPQIVPMSDGGVQLEWHKNGVEVEITFDGSGFQEHG